MKGPQGYLDPVPAVRISQHVGVRYGVGDQYR
jgi:hypothetical protein